MAQLQRAADAAGARLPARRAPGSGVEEAARCFAAALDRAGRADERAWDLVLRGVHPDVVEVDPPATRSASRTRRPSSTRCRAARSRASARSSSLFDAERLRLNEAAANKLLKTLEEPPPPGGDRPRHRRAPTSCSPPSARAASASTSRTSAPTRSQPRSLADGVAAPSAPSCSPRLAGGRLDRARALDGRHRTRARRVRRGGRRGRRHRRRGGARRPSSRRPRCRRRSPSSRPRRRPRPRSSTAELEAAGLPRTHAARSAAPARGTAQARPPARPHRRPARGHHRARDRLPRRAGRLGARSVLNTDHEVAGGRARAPRPAALDACRAARQAIAEFNPNETLLVERLFLHLPPGGRRLGTACGDEARASPGTLTAAPE